MTIEEYKEGMRKLDESYCRLHRREDKLKNEYLDSNAKYSMGDVFRMLSTSELDQFVGMRGVNNEGGITYSMFLTHGGSFIKNVSEKTLDDMLSEGLFELIKAKENDKQ